MKYWNGFITFIENAFNIKLPSLEKWYIQRVDISICFNLNNQTNVSSYINNLSYMSYPRRKTRFYSNESLYFSGTTTTLKIYNKLIEFKKHDISKFKDTDFDVFGYCKEIFGFLRFECEIRKKKLSDYFGYTNVPITVVSYDSLYSIWRSEFMKLYKFNENVLNIVMDNNDVRSRLNTIYSSSKASSLYGFYLSLINDGYNVVLKSVPKSSFYRKLGELKRAGIDFSQTAFVMEDFKYDSHFVDFNPFSDKVEEVS